MSHRNRYRGWYSSESNPHVEPDDWRPEVCEVQSTAAAAACYGGEKGVFVRNKRAKDGRVETIAYITIYGTKW